MSTEDRPASRDPRPLAGVARTLRYRIAPVRNARRPWTPAATLLIGFALLIAIGTVVLILPIASTDGSWTDPLTALFTAASAVCVTGLVVVDTATHWSAFGQVAILVMVQVGGFGFMTGSTFLLFLVLGRRTGLRDRLLAQASTGALDLGGVGSLVARIAAYTLIIEATGALIAGLAFAADGIEPVTAAWWGVFHSVTAFNNAGFDLTGGFQSMIPFADDIWLLATLGALTILGGLGYAIVGDVIARRGWRRLSLESKLVLITTALLLIGGTVGIAVFEWSDPATLGSMPESQRIVNAAFMSATLRSSGFASFDVGAMAQATLAISIALMFIGGASGSTAGGIKVNTFSILFVAIASTARGRQFAEAFGRRIEHVLIYRAMSVALLAIAIVFGTAMVIALLAPGFAFDAILFEAMSAFGTVGLSTGITPDLPPLAQIIITLAMYLGRLGPLTFVFWMIGRSRPAATLPAVERMRIG